MRSTWLVGFQGNDRGRGVGSGDRDPAGIQIAFFPAFLLCFCLHLFLPTFCAYPPLISNFFFDKTGGGISNPSSLHSGPVGWISWVVGSLPLAHWPWALGFRAHEPGGGGREAGLGRLEPPLYDFEGRSSDDPANNASTLRRLRQSGPQRFVPRGFACSSIPV